MCSLFVVSIYDLFSQSILDERKNEKLKKKMAKLFVAHFLLLFKTSFPSTTANTTICRTRSNTIIYWIIAVFTFHQATLLECKLYSFADFIWNECWCILCYFDIIESSKWHNSLFIFIDNFMVSSNFLSKIVLTYYPNHEMDAGRIGLCIVLAGMMGSVCCGIVLDKTHRFKWVLISLI